MGLIINKKDEFIIIIKNKTMIKIKIKEKRKNNLKYLIKNKNIHMVSIYCNYHSHFFKRLHSLNLILILQMLKKMLTIIKKK